MNLPTHAIKLAAAAIAILATAAPVSTSASVVSPPRPQDVFVDVSVGANGPAAAWTFDVYAPVHGDVKVKCFFYNLNLGVARMAFPNFVAAAHTGSGSGAPEFASSPSEEWSGADFASALGGASSGGAASGGAASAGGGSMGGGSAASNNSGVPQLLSDGQLPTEVDAGAGLPTDDINYSGIQDPHLGSHPGHSDQPGSAGPPIDFGGAPGSVLSPVSLPSPGADLDLIVGDPPAPSHFIPLSAGPVSSLLDDESVAPQAILSAPEPASVVAWLGLATLGLARLCRPRSRPSR